MRMKHTIKFEGTQNASHAIIEVFATSFAYEPVSTSAQPVPPIIAFHANAHDVRSTELAPAHRRAA